MSTLGQQIAWKVVWIIMLGAKRTNKVPTKNILTVRDVENIEQPKLSYGSAMRIFTITPRTVKKQKIDQSKHARGWTMPTHVRSAHYRSVWVGTGDNKHKELRKIETIIVNKDKDETYRARRLEL